MTNLPTGAGPQRQREGGATPRVLMAECSVVIEAPPRHDGEPPLIINEIYRRNRDLPIVETPSWGLEMLDMIARNTRTEQIHNIELKALVRKLQPHVHWDALRDLLYLPLRPGRMHNMTDVSAQIQWLVADRATWIHQPCWKGGQVRQDVTPCECRHCWCMRGQQDDEDSMRDTLLMPEADTAGMNSPLKGGGDVICNTNIAPEKTNEGKAPRKQIARTSRSHPARRRNHGEGRSAGQRGVNQGASQPTERKTAHEGVGAAVGQQTLGTTAQITMQTTGRKRRGSGEGGRPSRGRVIQPRPFPKGDIQPVENEVPSEYEICGSDEDEDGTQETQEQGVQGDGLSPLVIDSQINRRAMEWIQDPLMKTCFEAGTEQWSKVQHEILSSTLGDQDREMKTVLTGYACFYKCVQKWAEEVTRNPAMRDVASGVVGLSTLELRERVCDNILLTCLNQELENELKEAVGDIDEYLEDVREDRWVDMYVLTHMCNILQSPIRIWHPDDEIGA